jgi:hypothetical protein
MTMTDLSSPETADRVAAYLTEHPTATLRGTGRGYPTRYTVHPTQEAPA